MKNPHQQYFAQHSLAGPVGVLGLQGDVRRHLAMLELLGVTAKVVRYPEDLSDIQALIIPGGESTTISKNLVANDMTQPVSEFLASGKAVWGTCAGMILLSAEVTGGVADQINFNAIQISVNRNGYGSQIASFEADLEIPSLGSPSFRGVFIRSPLVSRVGESVKVLAEFQERPVLCRQGNVLVSSFHPELTQDTRLHCFFLKEVATCLDIQNGQLSRGARAPMMPSGASSLPS